MLPTVQPKSNEEIEIEDKFSAQYSRDQIKLFMDGALERSRRNPILEDVVGQKFHQLLGETIDLVCHLMRCNQEEIEWLALIEKVCQTMLPMDASGPFVNATYESERRKQDLFSRQRGLMEMTSIIGRKLLFEGKHELAIPPAIQCLRCSLDVYGHDSVKLVPAYLILGEASIGKGNLIDADEYLAHAEWTVLKASDATPAIKSKLYRNIGLLHTAKGDYDSARRLLAEDIYHAGAEWGTKDIHTCGGYFHLANVFYRQNKLEIAESLYAQVTDNWFDFLATTVSSRIAPDSAASFLNRRAKEHPPEIPLDEDQQAEVVKTLNAVYDITSKCSRPNYRHIVKTCQALCMLYYLFGDYNAADEFSKKADEAMKKLPEKVAAKMHALFPKIPRSSSVAPSNDENTA